ncbi:mechanosensitive ion channel family protein [Pseudoalteromonas sp. T1lg75]|uniref:mechanosensitive ion channel family protein n=1 Tax=Pseudoalteromonas sp. T1lg75 TaxID=2077102 RepID=UPI000CF7410A|nr:mechanosensitive ion channel family protein [Pseudoalteromonas sp. T1lg75]
MIEQEIAQVERYYQMAIDFLVAYSAQLVLALILLVFGLWLAQRVSRWIFTLMQGHKIDITLSTFTSNMVRVLLIVTFVVIALGKVGISVTPFVAAIGAASLGAGLALQGMLSNYGAGLAIIATRPFVVGDTITVKGVTGQVSAIELGMTHLRDEDEVEITIPNKHIVGEIIHNSFDYSLEEGTIGIAYDADYEQAEALILEVLASQGEVAQTPKPQVGINEFADSSVVLLYRYWAPTKAKVATRLEINKAVFKALQQAHIDIPFPQRVVTLKHEAQS